MNWPSARAVLLLATWLVTTEGWAVKVTWVDAPARLEAGVPFSIAWQDEYPGGDSIVIAATGDGSGAIVRTANTSKGNPLSLIAPDKPGTYELRYRDARSGEPVARQKVKVGTGTANLDVSDDVATVGANVAYSVEAGDYRTESLALIRKGARSAEITIVDGTAGSFTAPSEPGRFDVLYMVGPEYKVIDRHQLQVRQPELRIEAPASVQAAASFELTCACAEHEVDSIRLVSANKPTDAPGTLQYLDGSERYSFSAPEAAGSYELRFIQSKPGNEPVVLARHALQVQ